MAVIEQRGPLQWRVKVRRGGISASKTFMKRVDAERWAMETEVAIQRGAFRDLRPAQVPFSDIAKRYLEHVTPTKKSGDRESYRIAILLAAPEFRRPIGAIDATHVATFRDRRLATPLQRTRQRASTAERTLSAQTVRHELNTLSAIWEHARKEWSLPLGENPTRAIRKPQVAKSRSRRLSAAELGYLRRATTGVHALSEAMTLALETSMRLGELLSLTWKNVDVKAAVAHLPATKSGHARDVALSPAALKALGALRPLKPAAPTTEDEQAIDPVSGGSPALRAALAAARREGRVFHWRASDSFDKTWRRALQRARALYAEDQAASGEPIDPAFLADLRWHDLRHEAVSRLFEAGLNAFEVASMSGHRSMQMLARYTHVQASQLAKRLREP